jgi:hypothetical protein
LTAAQAKAKSGGIIPPLYCRASSFFIPPLKRGGLSNFNGFCKVNVRGRDWIVVNKEPFVHSPSGYAWEKHLPLVEASLELQNYIIAEHDWALKKHRMEWNLPA